MAISRRVAISATILRAGERWPRRSPTVCEPRKINALTERQSTKRVCVPNLKIAIRWFKQHAKELGVDPNRIVAGGSAGGTSACWARRTDGNTARIALDRTRVGDTLSLNSTSSRIITLLAKDSSSSTSPSRLSRRQNVRPKSSPRIRYLAFRHA